MGTAPTLPEPGTDWFDALDAPETGEPSMEEQAPVSVADTADPAAAAGQFPATASLFDDYFDMTGPLADAPAPPAPRPGWARRHRGALVLGGAVAAVAVIGSVSAAVLINSATPDVGPAASTPLAAGSAPTAHPAPPKPWCSGWAAGAPIDTTSADAGEATIAKYEAALYDARDGAKARQFVTPDAPIAAAGELTSVYAALPAGTEHCVLATPSGPGAYAVDLFTRNPDGTGMAHYAQTVTTTSTPTGPQITAISPRTDGK